MGEYRHKTTGEIKTQGEWRRAYPNTSFPRVWTQDTLDFLELDAVLSAPQPTPSAYQTVRKNGAVQDAKGNWVENWEVVSMFEEYTDEAGVVHTVAEQEAAYQARLDNEAAERNRRERDRRIAETDWWALSDVTMTDVQAAYRQALRDITTHANWPNLDEADWPVKP